MEPQFDVKKFKAIITTSQALFILLVEVLHIGKSVNYNMKFSIITFSNLYTKGLKGKAKYN
jgi:hypothetical protein